MASKAPREQTLLVVALDKMPGVKGREAFVRFAVLTSDADTAFFRRRQVQMYRGYHETAARIADFVLVGRLAAAQLKDGTLIFAAPVDHLVRTEAFVRYLDAAERDLKAVKPVAKQLWLAGRASDLARKNLEARGCVVQENAEAKLLAGLPY